MSLEIAELLGLWLYKLASLGAGCCMCWLGYRLFVLGIVTPAGDMSVSNGKSKLVLKAAAPGTFFAVLGAIVLFATVWKGFNANTTSNVGPAGRFSSTPVLEAPAVDLPAPPSPGSGQLPSGEHK